VKEMTTRVFDTTRKTLKRRYFMKYLKFLALGLIVVLMTGCHKKPTGPKHTTPTTGTLIIRSLPSGAVYAIDTLKKSGVTPDTLPDIKPGSYEVKLELAGHHSYTGTAVVKAGETTDFFGILPIGYGAINITSQPPGATVYVNTYQRGVTPLLVTDVPAGKASVRLTKAGYADWYNDSIYVVMDDTIGLSAVLDSLIGWVSVTSTPDGADIYFDTNPTPKTAPTIEPLPPGTHQIRAELNGYSTVTKTVTVIVFDTVDVHFDLVLITGLLKISSTPANAQISVDNLPTGQVTPASLTLTPGDHLISLRKAGYYDCDTTINVIASQTTTISLTLEPKPTSLSIATSPAGANIYLNGSLTEFKTPHTFTDMSAGLCQVRVCLTGYFPEDSAYTVIFGTDNQLYFGFDPAPNIPFAYTQGDSIYLANLDGIIIDTLAQDYLNFIDSYIDYNGTIRWSPNAQYLAYTGRTNQVTIISFDGSWVNGFSGNRSMDFCWSPDSDELVWGVYCGGLYKNILSNNWYGRISSGCYDNSPAFSLDGNQIMFMYHNWGRDCRVDLMNADGTGRRNIIPWFRAGFDEYNHLYWTTDSTAVFKIAGNGIFEVLISKADTVIMTEKIDDAVSQLHLSPDRKWCAYNTSSGIYLMQVGVWLPNRITSLSAYDFSVSSGGEYVMCRTANGVHFVTRYGNSYHIIADEKAGRGAVDIKP